MINIIKRDGSLDIFNEEKIINAINKAMIEVDGQLYEDDTSKDIAQEIAEKVKKYPNGSIEVEDIQNWVEDALMASERRDVAKAYIRYRYKREMVRQSNTTDQSIRELLDGTNDYWNNENSNKNAKRVTVQRDYMAGIVSTDISKRFLLSNDIVEAHNQGIIHFHDMDYFAQNALTNCELINLEDMLQNGTVVNGVLIEKPHRLLTATTIATQIIAAVTSSTYGGATISLTHLAPFVRDSYNRYLEKYSHRNLTQDQIEKFAKEDLQKEIEDSVQTFNYQTNSMTNTNGQSPFLSVCMYLNETKEYKNELAMLIEEFLKQRIKGFKNEKGVYVTPAFPKLLYILEEDNVYPDSKYWYLTELAAKCTAKRMVPDYISEKMMKKLKLNQDGEGQCYPCINKTCA